ncbi:hypothetical protein D3C71_1930820 [compost metagenome]
MRVARARFAAPSIWTPSQPSFSATRARTGAEFSPTPAVKTTASSPPMDAASPAACLATWKQNSSTASAACGFSLSSRARMSLETPDTPSSPDLW